MLSNYSNNQINQQIQDHRSQCWYFWSSQKTSMVPPRACPNPPRNNTALASSNIMGCDGSSAGCHHGHHYTVLASTCLSYSVVLQLSIFQSPSQAHSYIRVSALLRPAKSMASRVQLEQQEGGMSLVPLGAIRVEH